MNVTFLSILASLYNKLMINKMMKQLFLILSLLSVLLIWSCKSGSNYAVRGSGKIVSYEVPVKNFSEINVTGPCDMIYEQKVNKTPYLRIEIDENLKDLVSINSRNGKLHVAMKGNNAAASRYKVYTNSTGLNSLKISGSGNVNLKNTINSGNLKVSLSGSGSMKADKLKCGNLNLSISGSGNVSAGGEVFNSKIKLSGSGNADTFKLNAQNVTCDVSGSGSAKVYASESLSSRVSGSGGIQYKGSPKRKESKVSGSGSIKAK